MFGNKFGRKYDLLHNKKAGSRLILSNTITTNGLILNVHAIDITKKKIRSTTSENAGQSITSLSKASSKSKKMILDPIEPLINKEIDTNKCWFLGLDLGVRYTVGACAINGDATRNLAIKSKALEEPTRKYINWLTSKKTPRIYELERGLEEREGESKRLFCERWFRNYLELARFYNSKTVKKRQWDAKRAYRAEFDQATNALLKMVDTSINKRAKDLDNKNILIGNYISQTFNQDLALQISQWEREPIRLLNDILWPKCDLSGTKLYHWMNTGPVRSAPIVMNLSKQ